MLVSSKAIANIKLLKTVCILSRLYGVLYSHDRPDADNVKSRGLAPKIKSLCTAELMFCILRF